MTGKDWSGKPCFWQFLLWECRESSQTHINDFCSVWSQPSSWSHWAAGTQVSAGQALLKLLNKEKLVFQTLPRIRWKRGIWTTITRTSDECLVGFGWTTTPTLLFSVHHTYLSPEKGFYPLQIRKIKCLPPAWSLVSESLKCINWSLIVQRHSV